MKDRICDHLSNKFVRYNISYHPIALVDWTDITGEPLHAHNTDIATHPITGENINGVHISNSNNIEINVDAFLENALCYSKKRRSKQCECIVYPHNTNSDEWVLFVETKYANSFAAAFDPRNNYPEYAINQIKDTVHFFRCKGIIAPEKVVYAIVSFPNLCEQFSAFVFEKDETILDILQTDKIIIRATNTVHIKDELRIELIANS